MRPQVHFIHHLTSWTFEQVNILNDPSYNTINSAESSFLESIPHRGSSLTSSHWTVVPLTESYKPVWPQSFNLWPQRAPLWEFYLTQRVVLKVSSQPCFGWKWVETQSSSGHKQGQACPVTLVRIPSASRAYKRCHPHGPKLMFTFEAQHSTHGWRALFVRVIFM